MIGRWAYSCCGLALSLSLFLFSLLEVVYRCFREREHNRPRLQDDMTEYSTNLIILYWWSLNSFSSYSTYISSLSLHIPSIIVTPNGARGAADPRGARDGHAVAARAAAALASRAAAHRLGGCMTS